MQKKKICIDLSNKTKEEIVEFFRILLLVKQSLQKRGRKLKIEKKSNCKLKSHSF